MLYSALERRVTILNRHQKGDSGATIRKEPLILYLKRHFEMKPSQGPMLADENFIMYLILYITIIDLILVIQ